MSPRPDIISLVSLLDDEDEGIALNAMAELLYRERELGDLPALLQESENPLVRRRIHQLQAALTLRRRRREFLRMLASREFNLGDALIEIHLQWFDNDSRPELVRMMEDFICRLRRRPTSILRELSGAMLTMGITAERESTLHPENYCVGTVINDKIGAGSLLCLLAIAAAEGGKAFRLVRSADEFGLTDGEGVLLPTHNWMVIPQKDACALAEFPVPEALRYASAMLFSCAVNSDSFRYVLTIAQALSGAEDDLPLDYLPYPYHPEDGPEEPEVNDAKN